MWIELAVRAKQKIEDDQDNTEFKEILNKAVEQAGLGWDSQNLWSFAAMSMIDMQEIEGALCMYRSAVQIPTPGLNKHVSDLKQFLDSYYPKEEAEVILGDLKTEIRKAEDELQRRMYFDSQFQAMSKNLTEQDLAKFRAYIDYLASSENVYPGDKRDVRLLYERLLVKFPNHEKVWLEFIEWDMEHSRVICPLDWLQLCSGLVGNTGSAAK